jgi:hypothetical protein
MMTPSFLVFCVAQMQSLCLGGNGHKLVREPHINAIAADGTGKLPLPYYGFQSVDYVLVNLADDPSETRNLWNEPGLQARNVEMLAKLANRLTQSDRCDKTRISGT